MVYFESISSYRPLKNLKRIHSIPVEFLWLNLEGNWRRPIDFPFPWMMVSTLATGVCSMHEPDARGLLGTGRQRGPVFEAQVTTKCILSSRFNVNYNTADDGECDGEILRRIEIAEVRSGGCGKY